MSDDIKGAGQTHLTAILDSLSASIAILDRQGKIVRVNESWKNFARENNAPEVVIYGTGCDYLQVCRNAVSSGDSTAAKCLAGLESIQSGKNELFELEYPCGSAVEDRWFLFRAAPLKSETGGMVISHIDLTSLKQSAEIVREQREQLTRTHRAAALGQLSATLAHELNQPLTAILSNAQALRRLSNRDTLNLTESREIANEIIDDSKRAHQVMESVRAMLKQSPFEETVLSINDIIESISEMLHHEADIKRVDLKLDLTHSLPQILGDSIQLQQVIMNLVLNAFDALQEQLNEQRRVTIRSQIHNGDEIHVWIQDNGVGFGERNSEQVFTPFHTTKADGLGLGLAICRTIVELHGGQIRGSSSPGNGAIFEFTIPAYSKAP